MSDTKSLLFSPLTIKGLTLKNRIVVAPMCQYSAIDGFVGDWHIPHLTQFALGGAGLVLMEATAVTAEGRISHGCSGLWSDDHVEPLRPIIRMAQSYGAAIGIQLGHAGRKASTSRPWDGEAPLGDADVAHGEPPWQTVGPSAIAFDEGWPVPHALTTNEIAGLINAWCDAARRAHAAGFDVVEIHMAHGYLAHSFLSPIANQRTDAYGGSEDNCMRFGLELVEAVRAVWPQEKPLFVRVSAIDGKVGGLTLDNTVTLAKHLKSLGVDVIDCSSGGISGSGISTMPPRAPGYQVDYASTVRRDAEIKTQAVGLITSPAQAETILTLGAADLIALAREVLSDPHWPRHAARALGETDPYADMPIQYAHWLRRRAGSHGETPSPRRSG
ncbi:MAG: NADH:flavin oxidoreductase/NADH oxidase [Pseudomonadota bacterium]